jgi:hypothetical protein
MERIYTDNKELITGLWPILPFVPIPPRATMACQSTIGASRSSVSLGSRFNGISASGMFFLMIHLTMYGYTINQFLIRVNPCSISF